MNIFVLDENPIVAAEMHCDKHVPKLIVETAQMMASALRRHGATDEVMPIAQTSGKPYKGGYHNHPCTIFVGDTHMNYLWTAHLGIALCREYQKRFQRTHACQAPIYQMMDLFHMIPIGGLTEFARAFQKDNPDMDDLYDTSKFTAVEAYRQYYLRGKAHFAKWERGTPAPSWWVIQ
tara:strand:- start:6918 stop:7448 length:531 start_codon:yes stop_codon:yes gene_type:complete